MATPPAAGSAYREWAATARRRSPSSDRIIPAGASSLVVAQVAPPARLLGAVLRLLALDAQVDVGHQLQALGRDGLVALGAQAVAVGVVLEPGQRRLDLAQLAGARAVAARGDGLRHLGQGL